MSTHDRPSVPDNGSERTLRELFAHAAPRPAPPEADAEEIRRAVYAEWDAVTGRRVFWRRAGSAVAAAAVVGAVALFVLDTGKGPLPMVATVERVQGNVEVDGVPLRIGAALEQDARLATHSGRVSLRLVDGGSLRLAAQTELTLLAGTEAKLDAGKLYFDSNGSAATSKFAVRTGFGTLRDVGTQFIAELDSTRLDIGVRDGRVALLRGTENVAADAGERVTVPRGSGSVRRQPIDRFGADWAWAEQLAQPFEIDGRQLIDFLDWVARETGRTLVFADANVERAVRETVLSGSMELDPLRKLAAVMALTDFDYTIDGGRIIVRARQ